MISKTPPIAVAAAFIVGLFALMPAGKTLPLPVEVHEPGAAAAGMSGIVRVHGTNEVGPHCHQAWSTSVGWHLHRRDCDLPDYNPEWRDPRHWHWRLYEEARERRHQRRYWHERSRHYKY